MIWPFRPRTEQRQRIRNRPNILISLDRSWVNWIGLSWFTYARLIRKVGGVPDRVLYRLGPREEEIPQIASEMIESHDALLLSGGGDVNPDLYGQSVPSLRVNPLRDRFECELIAQARCRRMPILGICRGCQLLNVAFGGTLHMFRDQPEHVKLHGYLNRHLVELDATSRFASIVGSPRISQVRSTHGQAVHQAIEPMRVVGQAMDRIVECIECTDPDQWAIGVQWHPELMWDDREELPLFHAFVTEALDYKNRKDQSS